MRLLRLKRLVCAAVALGLGICAASGTASAISGTTNIEGQLEMKGASATAGEFTFELRKSGSDTVLATTTNRADGKIVFENIPYSDEDIIGGKYVVFEVTEKKGSDDTIVYDSNVGYVTLELEEGTGVVENISYAKPTSEEISYEDFEYGVYHATEEELQGVAYSVYDSRDNSLVFFRDAEGAHRDNEYVYLEERDSSGMSHFLVYDIVPESGDEEWGSGWASRATSVVFKDAVRPEKLSFQGFTSCRSFDLRKLDTSKMTDMSRMFGLLRNDAASSINVSNFDLTNVTTLYDMFNDDQSLRRIIWTNSDTPVLENIDYLFHNSPIESFDFSRINTTNLKSARGAFSSSSSIPIRLQRADFSGWTPNGEVMDGQEVNYFNTESILVRFAGDYLDITSFGKFYSAELYAIDMSRTTKVLKVCMYPVSRRSDLFPGNVTMLNINTGETHTGVNYEDHKEYCGTYVRLGLDSMSFVNRKKTSVSVSKVDENGAPLSGATMALKMDGSLIYSWDTNGEAHTFTDLAYGHDYEIVELESPAGYKLAEPVQFSVSEDGELSCDPSIVIADEPDLVKVRKIWDDSGMENFRPETIKFELYNVRSNEKVDEIALSQADANSLGDWEGAFRVMDRYDADGYENSYKVVEESLVNYATTYQMNDSSTPSAGPIVGNSVIVTNKYTGAKNDYSFKKQWDDAGFESERPESVSFKLYEQSDMSKAVREVTLTADNADENDANIWRGVFEELPSLNSDGSTAKYVVVEDTLTGYETSYATLEDEDDIDILDFNCELLDDSVGNFLGIVADVTDKESGTVHMRQFSLADSNITRLSVESSNYEILISPLARCTGSVVRGSRDSLTTNYSESESDSSAYGDSFDKYTYEPVTRDDIFTAEPTWDMNRPNTFALNKEDYVPATTEEQSEPFAGANLIINHRVTEEEKPVDTSDKIAICVIVFIGSLSGCVITKRALGER